MGDQPASIISHVSIGTNDLERACAFYDAVLKVLGCGRVMEHEGAVAYGHGVPEFWVQRPFDGGVAQTANGVHVGFIAGSPDEVDAFFAAAIAAGGVNAGEPGPRPLYGEPYYGCFVRDPDGHKIEATFWDAALARKLGMGG